MPLPRTHAGARRFGPRSFIAGLLIAVAAIVPLALAVLPFGTVGSQEKAIAGGQQKGPPPVPVEAAKVTQRPLGERVTAVGTLISNESVVVRSEIAGRITQILFEEGRPVSQGDRLFVLDDSIYRAELAEAQARMKLAQRNSERTEELFANKITSARTRDEAISQLEVSKATVDLARMRLAKTVITAPFDGIMGLRKVSVGDYISAGEDLVNLEDIDPIKVDFRVAERFLAAVRPGQSIAVRVDAFPDREFTGEVYAIDPKLDAEGRSILIRARIPNQDRLLRPGLFARVTLTVELKPNALTVPEQALVPRGGDQFVYKVVDGKAAQTKVLTGIRRDGSVEILDGLAADDVVVTAGQLKIRDGAPVKVLPSAGTGA